MLGVDRPALLRSLQSDELHDLVLSLSRHVGIRENDLDLHTYMRVMKLSTAAHGNNMMRNERCSVQTWIASLAFIYSVSRCSFDPVPLSPRTLTNTAHEA